MKKIIFYVFSIVILISCGKPKLGDNTNPNTVKTYCQSKPNKEINKIDYLYNSKNKVISESYGQSGNTKRFEYNSDNSIASEILETDLVINEKKYIYNQNKQLINVMHKQYENGELISEKDAPLEYSNSLLIKEWKYWGAFSIYEYDGDKIIKKIDYTKDGQKHHTTKYVYNVDLIIEESKETTNGSNIYTNTYQYNSNDKLTQIIDKNNNVLEQYEYVDNKLMKKIVNYFDIDPGYSICDGNYIYRYEY